MSFIDQHLFEKANELGRVSILPYFSGDKAEREQQRVDWINDRKEVHLEYPRLEELDLSSMRSDYKQFLDELQSEPNSFLQKAYSDWCHEQLQYLDLLEAMKHQDDLAFEKATSAAFGEPRKEIFSQMLVTIDQFLEESTAKESVKYLRSVLAGVPRADKPFLEDITLSSKRAKQDAPKIVKRLQQALEDYQIKDWKVIIDRESTNLSVHVDQDTRTVVVPEERKMPLDHLEALAVHEIGVHVRRRQNAEAGKFGLLALGLGGYLQGDEGLSKYEEQKVYNQSFLPSIEIYLGISLIRGLAGKKLGFAEIFDFYKHYYYMSRYQIEPTEEHANNHAWNRTIKFFRGTTGRTSGVCLTKDVIYVHGYLGVIEALKTDPAEEKRLLAGKYDPGNEDHREILTGLGITN